MGVEPLSARLVPLEVTKRIEQPKTRRCRRVFLFPMRLDKA